jgi:hypothetical protein
VEEVNQAQQEREQQEPLLNIQRGFDRQAEIERLRRGLEQVFASNRIPVLRPVGDPMIANQPPLLGHMDNNPL